MSDWKVEPISLKLDTQKISKKKKTKKKIKKVSIKVISTVSNRVDKRKISKLESNKNDEKIEKMKRKRHRKFNNKPVDLNVKQKQNNSADIKNTERENQTRFVNKLNVVNNSGNNKNSAKEKKVLHFNKGKRKITNAGNIYEIDKKRPLIEDKTSKTEIKKQKCDIKLKGIYNEAYKQGKSSINSKQMSLRERMLNRLKSSRFRYINEQIYTIDGKDAEKMFKEDPEAFQAYHEGYRQQLNKWPINPLNVIVKSIKNMPKTHVIADMGCGDATLAKSVEQKVYSFDLVAINELVTECNMSQVPLANQSVDVVVFCLSLMGTNLRDFIFEANRILKKGGVMKIAEIGSRFDKLGKFIYQVTKYGFEKSNCDLSHNLFYFLDFKKRVNIVDKKNLPVPSLKPCLYKKR